MPKASKQEVRKGKVDVLHVAGEFKPSSVDLEKRTVEIVFTTGQSGLRYDWWNDRYYEESLRVDDASIRQDRLKKGLSVIDSHKTYEGVRNVFGITETYSIGGGQIVGIARFSENHDDIFKDVADGILRHVSLGYNVYEYAVTEKQGETEKREAVDWEPVELSLVPVSFETTNGTREKKSQKEKENGHEVRLSYLNKEKEAIVPKETNDKGGDTQKRNPPEPVDVSAIKTQARKDEMERIREISAMADEFDNVANIRELKDEHIEGDLTVDSMRQAVLAKMGEQRKASVTSDASRELGLSDKEVRNFSWINAMAVVANPNDKATRERAAFEIEVSRAVEDATGDSTSGIFVSDDILRGNRQMNVTINATGGAATVDTDLRTDSFIDLLRNESIVNRMGATVVTGLVGDLAFPRQNGGGTMSWITPEGGDASETDQSIDQVPMSPKQAGCFTSYTRKIFKQSSIDIDAFIQRDLQMVMALGIDKAAIYGTGAGGQPTGLMLVTGIGAVAFGLAGQPTYVELVALETQIATANADVGKTQTAVSTGMRGTLKTTQKAAGTNGAMVWGDNNTVNGYNAVASNQVVANDVIHGNWSDLMIGMWGGLDLMVNPFTKAKSGGVDIIVLQDIDIAVRNPVSFVVGQ